MVYASYITDRATSIKFSLQIHNYLKEWVGDCWAISQIYIGRTNYIWWDNDEVCFVGRLMSCLNCFNVCACWWWSPLCRKAHVPCLHCFNVCACFYIVGVLVFLCLVCPMLLVSLDCSLFIAPLVFSNVYCTKPICLVGFLLLFTETTVCGLTLKDTLSWIRGNQSLLLILCA